MSKGLLPPALILAAAGGGVVPGGAHVQDGGCCCLATHHGSVDALTYKETLHKLFFTISKSIKEQDQLPVCQIANSNQGHRNKAADHKYAATQMMVDIPPHKLRLDAMACSYRFIHFAPCLASCRQCTICKQRRNPAPRGAQSSLNGAKHKSASCSMFSCLRRCQLLSCAATIILCCVLHPKPCQQITVTR